MPLMLPLLLLLGLFIMMFVGVGCDCSGGCGFVNSCGSGNDDDGIDNE